MTEVKNEDDMIKFREKSYSRLDDVFRNDIKVLDLIKMLDKNKISNYGLGESIPNDSISINYDENNKLVINIPLDLNQFQYDIEDYFLDSSPRIRYSSLTSRNLLRYYVKNSLTTSDVYNFIIYIIKTIGYVVICPSLKK